MKKIFLVILLSLTLSAQTLSEYKGESILDMINFQATYSPAFKDKEMLDTFTQTNATILKAFIEANSYQSMDFYVLMYLNYKQNFKMRLQQSYEAQTLKE